MSSIGKWVYVSEQKECGKCGEMTHTHTCLVCGDICCDDCWNERTSTCDKCISKAWWRDL